MDVAGALAQEYPQGTVILTWVCTRCHRGWTLPSGRRPSCGVCGQVAEQRGAHAAIPIEVFDAG